MSIKPKAILVTGDRNWDDYDAMRKALLGYPQGTILLHGNAAGADSVADLVGMQEQFAVLRMPYFKWAGRGGGPQRNRKMLIILEALRRYGYDCEVKAFHDDLQGKSKGTKDMVGRAKHRGFKVTLHRHRPAREASDA